MGKWWMRDDECVHPARISLEEAAIARAAPWLRDFFAALAQAQNSLLAIELERVLANNFRQLSAASAPDHIHLPQPVLRRDISLREKQIVERLPLQS